MGTLQCRLAQTASLQTGALQIGLIQVGIRQKSPVVGGALPGLALRLEPFAMLAQQLLKLRHRLGRRTTLVIGIDEGGGRSASVMAPTPFPDSPLQVFSYQESHLASRMSKGNGATLSV